MGTSYREWSEPESEQPLGHFLNLIEQSKAFCSHAAHAGTAPSHGSGVRSNVSGLRANQVAASLSWGRTSMSEETSSRRKLFACVNLSEVRGIDPSSESFTCKLRLYLLWCPEVALDSHCKREHGAHTVQGVVDGGEGGGGSGSKPSFESRLREFEEKAAKRVASGEGDYYPLTPIEAEAFSAMAHWPSIKFFNAISTQVLDDTPGVRVYNPSAEHGSTILWNCQYLLELRSHFRLKDFPFDQQELCIEMRQDDPRTWDLFDLTVCVVQFHKNALDLAEWGICLPAVRRGAPSHKSTDVILRVKRHSTFFVMNVIGILSMLSLLTFVVFALPLADLSDRINVILTLFLTSVAFKFVIGETIPKVGYTTLLDTFVLANMTFLFLSSFVCVAGAWLFGRGTKEVAGIELNAFLCLATIFLLVGLDGWWLRCVSRSRHLVSPRLRASEERTWYAFTYANPFFLQPPAKAKDD